MSIHIEKLEDWCFDAPANAVIGTISRCGLVLEKRGLGTKVRRYRVFFDESPYAKVHATLQEAIEHIHARNLIIDPEELKKCQQF